MMPSSAAIAGLVATVAIVAPARAAILNNWSFDPATRQLTVTLPNGVTPTYFLLAQPARIVLDMPNTSLGTVQSDQQYSGAIRSIRLSELQNSSRAVIEFAPNTLLDPRHAELTSQDLGNGQTEWTLRPLLQDAANATVATAPAPASPARVAPAASQPPAAAPPPQPQEASPAPPTPLPAPAAISPTPEAAPPPAPTVAPDPEPTPDEEPSTPIAVIPAPSPPATVAETAGDLPTLPDIANSATTGAVQALPSGSQPSSGVRTDAAALAGVGDEPVSDLPPEQLPIDPFASSSQATVSVPSLEEADQTPAPQVSVPAIADVPNVPATAQSPTPSAPPSATTANQVRPPGDEAIATAPAAAPPPAPVAPVTNDNRAADPAVVANSIEIPAIPLPPDSWGDRPNAELAPNEVRPPSSEAIAQAPATSTAASQTRPPAPTNTTETAPSPRVSSPPTTVASDIRPPAPVSESTVPVAPPPTRANVPSPPPVPVTAAPNPAADSEALPPPPFLEGTGTPAAIEQPSIPPPPSRPRSDGTVPFGAPLPQSKAVDAGVARPFASTFAEIPVGTRMALQYSGSAPLVLEEQAPVYEVLRVVGDVYNANGALIVPAGTEVLGRFEGFDDSGRRFVTQVLIQEGDRQPLLAESDWLIGTPQPHDLNLAIGSGIGAAAVTVLTGLSGIGIVGGAAVGAAAAAIESPRLVTIEPGEIIEVEVVSDILPFNDAPDITRQYPQ